MPEENVELVRRGFAAYNRRDLDGTWENWAPDAVLDWSTRCCLRSGTKEEALEAARVSE
jgi:ketosteroid isomerase-like protein